MIHTCTYVPAYIYITYVSMAMVMLGQVASFHHDYVHASLLACYIYAKDLKAIAMLQPSVVSNFSGDDKFEDITIEICPYSNRM